MKGETYFHSDALNLPGKIDLSGNFVINDKKLFGKSGLVTYSMDEARILKKLGGIDPIVHLVKNLFDGEIVEND